MYTKNHIHEHTQLPTNLNGTAERSQIYLHIHTMVHYVVLSKNMHPTIMHLFTVNGATRGLHRFRIQVRVSSCMILYFSA